MICSAELALELAAHPLDFFNSMDRFSSNLDKCKPTRNYVSHTCTKYRYIGQKSCLNDKIYWEWGIHQSLQFWSRHLIIISSGSFKITKSATGAHEAGVFFVYMMNDGTILSGGGKDRRIIQWDDSLKPTGAQGEVKHILTHRILFLWNRYFEENNMLKKSYFPCKTWHF